MKRLFKVLAILSLCLGAGLIGLPSAQAKAPAPIAVGALPELGSGLPTIVAGHHLLEAHYWRYRYYHRYRWHPRYRYYHRWHYRHWRYHRYHRWHYHRRWRY